MLEVLHDELDEEQWAKQKRIVHEGLDKVFRWLEERGEADDDGERLKYK